MIYWQLFLGFLKVGCFAFGGAYGAIPLIREVVLSYGWLSEEMVSYMIAVSESTPGPIMVNMATYVGSTQAGFLGAMIATLSVVLPSFAVILLITVLLQTILKNRYVRAVMEGLIPCVTGIVLATGIVLVLGNCFRTVAPAVDVRALIITLLLTAILVGSRRFAKKKVSPILLILIAACLGVVFY